MEPQDGVCKVIIALIGAIGNYIISIATLFIALVTTSHDPSSRWSPRTESVDSDRLLLDGQKAPIFPRQRNKRARFRV